MKLRAEELQKRQLGSGMQDFVDIRLDNKRLQESLNKRCKRLAKEWQELGCKYCRGFWITKKEKDQWLNVPVHGGSNVLWKRSLPKVQSSTRPGIESKTSWLAVRDLTNCVNLNKK